MMKICISNWEQSLRIQEVKKNNAISSTNTQSYKLHSW